MTLTDEIDMGTKNEAKLTSFVVLCLVIVATVVVFGWLTHGRIGTAPTHLGDWFDSFNMLDTAFSGLAFAGVIYAILLQRRELALQREELEATRSELRRAAEAQEQSQQALKDQVEALNKTVQISQNALEPIVIVYAAADESRPTVMLLMIENVGRGAAKDVQFIFPGTLPQQAWGISGLSEPVKPMHAGPLLTGIPFLPPGGTRRMTWGQFGGLRESIGDKPAVVTATFRNIRGESQPEVTCLLDVKSFEHTDAVDSDGARQSARHLESIAKDLHNVAIGFSRPHILTQPIADYRTEQADRVSNYRKATVAPLAPLPEEQKPPISDSSVNTSELNSEWAQHRPG